MAENQTVTTAVFRAEEEGVAATAAALGKLQTAAGGASSATSQFAKTSQESAAKVGEIERELVQMERRLAGAPAAWSSFERGMRAATNGLAAGKLTVEQYQRSVQQLQTQLQRVVAPRLTMDVDASGLAQLLGTTQKVSTATRQATNDLLRMAQAKQAADAEMARSQEVLSREMDTLHAKATKLRAELDPLSAAQQRYNTEVAEFQTLADRQLITQDQLAEATRRSRQAFDDTASSLKPVNDNLQLAGHQIGNLRSQVIDAGTMIASGSSFTQVLATQSGQVYEAIAGQKGITAGLQDLKGTVVGFGTTAAQFLGPQGLILAGLTAAASAVVMFGTKAADRMERVNKSAEGFRATLADIRKSNSDLADMIERVSDASARLSPKDAQNKLAADIQAQRRAIEEARQGASQAALSTGGWNPLFGVKELFGTASGDTTQITLAQLTEGFLRGSKSAETLRSEMLALKASVDTPSYLRDSIDQVLAFADAAIKAEGDIRGFETGLARLRAEAAKLRFDDASNALKGLLPDVSEVEAIERTYRSVLGRIEQLKGSDKQLDRDGLRETARRQRDEALAELSRPARESLAAVQDSLNNLDLSPVQRQIAETTQEYDRRIAEYKRTTNDAAGLADLQAEKEAALQIVLKETTRAEEARQANYQLQLSSIGDITAAQKAATAGQQAYNDAIAAGQGDSYARARQEEAATLSMAQARQQLSEASRQATEATQRQIEQAQLEYDLVGKSAGEVARLRAEFDLLAQAKDAARSAGFDEAQVKLTEEMRRQAAEIGRVADETERLNLARDQDEQMRMLQAEAGLIYANDDARRVAIAGLEAEAELRRRGIDLNGEWGASYVKNARDMAATENALDRQREAFEGLHDAAGDFFSSLASGKGVLESLGSAFGKLANDLASKGFDQIFGGLFGSGGKAATSSNVAAAIANAASSVPTPTPRPIYQSPSAPYSEKYALPPVVTGEGFSASKAASVASKSVPAQMWNFFANKGLAAHQIAGILGNAKAESSFNPTAVGDNGQAFGLFQHNDRKNSLFNFIGGRQNLSDVNAQLEFVWKELNTTEGKAYKRLLAAKDYFEANEAMISFERPSGYQNGVKNAHNYSGRLAFTKEAYETYNGAPVTKNEYQKVVRDATASGVKEGVKATSYDMGGYDASSAGQGGLFGQRGMAGFNVLGAGIGAFSNGYASGSPLSGGIGGIFTGLGASQSIATAFPGLAGIAGPLGAIGGAALGILGGILGARKQRKEAHKQAAAQWEEIRRQYEAFDQSLSGEGKGNIREWLTSTWSQLSSFMSVGGKAWKMGTGNSTAQFQSTGTKMFARFHEMIDEFRDGFDDMVEDLSSGEGLAGAFAKGRAATKDLQKQIDGMLDDVAISFGSADIGIPTIQAALETEKEWEERRNAAIERAKQAAGEYSLSLLYTAKTTSDIAKSIDGFRGTAAGLHKVLIDLGWSAEEAAADINDRLNQAIAMMGETFVDGFQRQIDDLSGVGYNNDIADLIKSRETAMSDAALLGVDPAIVTKWFGLAAQEVVNGAELTGDAFDALVAKFPELAGVVKAFVEEVEDNTKQVEDAYKSFMDTRLSELISERANAEGALRSEYERTVSFVDGIKDYLRESSLDETYSTLSSEDRFKEAQRLYRETLFKANGNDSAAQEALIGAARDYREMAKAYLVSSEGYGDVNEEIASTLKGTAAKTETALDVARRQATFLSDIADGTKGLSGLLREYLDAAQKVMDQQKLVDGNRTFGLNPERNRMIDAAVKQVGLNYTGNYGIVNGADPFLQWRSALPPEQRAVVEGIINQYIGINRQMGGLIPGYANGGIVGNGIWNKDSVLARYAGGGSIGLAGGEMVISAPKVTPQTYPVLDAINRTGRVPGGSDNRELVAALGRVENLLRLQVQTTGQGLRENTAAVETGNRSSEQMALASRRQSAKAA